MAPGERNKFGVPVFESEVFRKQMYSFEKSAYDIVVTFWPPQWFGARGILPPCPLVTPLVLCKNIGKISENKQIFKSERHELLFHEHLQFSKTIRLDLAQTANKGCWRPGTPERGLGWGAVKSWEQWNFMKSKKVVTNYAGYCSTTMLTSKIVK